MNGDSLRIYFGYFKLLSFIGVMAFQLSSERSISEDRVIHFVVGDKKDKDTASPRAGEEPKGINSGKLASRSKT